MYVFQIKLELILFRPSVFVVLFSPYISPKENAPTIRHGIEIIPTMLLLCSALKAMDSPKTKRNALHVNPPPVLIATLMSLFASIPRSLSFLTATIKVTQVATAVNTAMRQAQIA